MSNQEPQDPTTNDVDGRSIPDADQVETADDTEGHGARKPDSAESDEAADDTEGHAAKVRLGYVEQDETGDGTEGHGRYYRLPDRERG